MSADDAAQHEALVKALSGDIGKHTYEGSFCSCGYLLGGDYETHAATALLDGSLAPLLAEPARYAAEALRGVAETAEAMHAAARTGEFVPTTEEIMRRFADAPDDLAEMLRLVREMKPPEC